MDVIVLAVLIVIAIFGAACRKLGALGRAVTAIAFLFQLVGLAVLYKENIGITFTSLGISTGTFSMPMTWAAQGLPNLPQAGLIFIILLLATGAAAVA